MECLSLNGVYLLVDFILGYFGLSPALVAKMKKKEPDRAKYTSSYIKESVLSSCKNYNSDGTYNKKWPHAYAFRISDVWNNYLQNDIFLRGRLLTMGIHSYSELTYRCQDCFDRIAKTDTTSILLDDDELS